MKTAKPRQNALPLTPPALAGQLAALHLPYMGEHYEAVGQQAAEQQWAPVDYLARLVEGELQSQEDRRVERRVKAARFPMVCTLDRFEWSWPKKINRPQVQNLFRLAFVEQAGNVIFIGNVGLGKTHLSIALGHAACLKGLSVLFASAVDIINALTAAQVNGSLKREMAKYLKPRVLLIDELGYLPIDKLGADLLFQIIAKRYEKGSLIVTSNRPYKRWSEIFNHDATLTSALLDRLLHHAETVVIEGNSYRMKDQIATVDPSLSPETPPPADS